MFRLTISASIVVTLFTSPAFAADGATGTPATTVTIQAVAADSGERPAVLPMLYVSLAGLQAYDVYSTHQGLALGAREASPLMAGAAGDTTGMVVMKTVSTATTIVLVERLWHRNRAAAIVTMIVANGLMAAVAANNARVLHQTR
jgi:hypothetical protein